MGDENVAELMRKIRPNVEKILAEHERARDCDKFLYMVYLRTFVDGKKIYNANFDEFARYICSGDVPIPESISRVRRKIQEEGLYHGEKRKARLAKAKPVAEWSQQ